MNETPSIGNPADLVSDTPTDGGPIARAGDVADDPEAQRLLATLRRRLADVHEPARVDRFEIRRKVGAGGMGVVYAAWDPDLRREVAIKVVQHGSGADPARFAREARALAELSHPNVVTVYASGSLPGGGLFIAMELVDGTTLDRWLEDQPRSIDAILEVFIAAGNGLAAAHRIGLVHRDFKPGNVLVGTDGRARVVDFGLVRRAESDAHTDSDRGDWIPRPQDDDSLSHTGTILGTPAYMSIE
ncbi:MAG: serine/threonine-protein kinase [Kineosporiaceae bacterium]